MARRATPAARVLPRAAGREGMGSSAMGRGGGAERRGHTEIGSGVPPGGVLRAKERRRCCLRRLGEKWHGLWREGEAA